MARKPGVGRHANSVPDMAARVYVAHWQRAPSRMLRAPTGTLEITTCLRTLWISPTPLPQDLAGTPERFEHRDAHRFLLEVMTGLRSKIAGETNVLGQCRRAWRSFGERNPRRPELQTLMHRLFSQAAEIRRTYLEGIGGASYGSLLRMLLRPARDDRILIVGAGALAQSILPYLRAWPIGVWNHRNIDEQFSRVRIFAPEEAEQAAAWGEHVVMTTPADACNDLQWAQLLSRQPKRSVVHLGHRRGSHFPLPTDTRSWQLDDLFDLAEAQANVRSLQVERARRACAELALAEPTRLPALQANS